MNITEIKERTSEMLEQLLVIWEACVRATHLFLSDAEIRTIKTYVPEALAHVSHLVIAMDEEGSSHAFMSVGGVRIEMLFAAPEQRGKGIGKMLVQYAHEHYAVSEVAVNEQNPDHAGSTSIWDSVS
ncbi:GNAT family N-acetyltransferase [Selenomonas sp. TAMA-11512]|uniref:GNAT family N-acetyltransferase n=1 Tax=Selenomonas sp. TAMA-11512 TaxID=3095337 RepID=UPI0030871019|nr:GNAT family N-acetyltransferase [Selenomonas sp. TAMA-11512]